MRQLNELICTITASIFSFVHRVFPNGLIVNIEDTAILVETTPLMMSLDTYNPGAWCLCSVWASPGGWLMNSYNMRTVIPSFGCRKTGLTFLFSIVKPKNENLSSPIRLLTCSWCSTFCPVLAGISSCDPTLDETQLFNCLQIATQSVSSDSDRVRIMKIIKILSAFLLLFCTTWTVKISWTVSIFLDHMNNYCITKNGANRRIVHVWISLTYCLTSFNQFLQNLAAFCNCCFHNL